MPYLTKEQIDSGVFDDYIKNELPNLYPEEHKASWDANPEYRKMFGATDEEQAQYAPKAPEPEVQTPAATSGDFVTGLKRGVQQTQAMAYGSGGLAGSMLEKAGLETIGKALKDFGLKGYHRNIEEAGQYQAKHSFKDVYTGKSGVGGAIDWAQGTLGELVPSMAEAAIGAVAGSFLAPGAGTAVGAFGARTLLRKGIEKATNEAIKSGVKGVTRAQLRKQVTGQALKKLGGKVGMGAAVMPMESGGMYAGLLEEHGIDAPETALLFGALATALEYAGGNSKLVNNLVDDIAKGSWKTAKKTATELLKNIPEEALQEGGQEVFSILNTVANTDEKLLTANHLEQIVESMAAGAVGGGAGAVGQGVLGRSSSQENQIKAEKARKRKDVSTIETLKGAGFLNSGDSSAGIDILGGADFINQPIGDVVDRIITASPEEWVAQLNSRDLTSEHFQGIINELAESGVDVNDEAVVRQAIVERVVPAMTMGLQVGLGTVEKTTVERRQLIADLNNLEDPKARAKAVAKIEEGIENPKTAKAWANTAMDTIDAGEEIQFNPDFVEYASQGGEALLTLREMATNTDDVQHAEDLRRKLSNLQAHKKKTERVIDNIAKLQVEIQDWDAEVAARQKDAYQKSQKAVPAEATEIAPVKDVTADTKLRAENQNQIDALDSPGTPANQGQKEVDQGVEEFRRVRQQEQEVEYLKQALTNKEVPQAEVQAVTDRVAQLEQGFAERADKKRSGEPAEIAGPAQPAEDPRIVKPKPEPKTWLGTKQQELAERLGGKEELLGKDYVPPGKDPVEFGSKVDNRQTATTAIVSDQTILDEMQAQAQNTSTRGYTYDEDGNKNYHAASSPIWMDNLQAAAKAAKQPLFTRKEIDTLIDNTRGGKPLTERQQARFDLLQTAAQEVKTTDPTFAQAYEAEDMEAQGFEVVGSRDMVAADFEDGSSFVGTVNGTKDTWTVRQGESSVVMASEASGLERSVDLFDTINVEGLKKASGQTPTQQGTIKKSKFSKTKGKTSKTKAVKDGVHKDTGRDDTVQSTEQKRVSRASKQMAHDTGADSKVEAPVTRDEKRIAKAIKRVFGLKIVYYSSENESVNKYNGFTNPGEKVIYLNKNSNNPMAFIAGHELLHQLKAQHPELYTRLLKKLKLKEGSLDAYIKKQGETYEGDSNVVGDIEGSIEELLADFTGDQLTDPDFLEMLATDATLFEAVTDLLRSILRKLQQTAFGTPYIANVKEMQTNLASALKEFSKAQNKAKLQSMVGEKYSKSPKREKSTGRYVGAPDWVGNSPHRLGALNKKLQKLTLEGVSGRYWYENSSKAILNITGGNKEEAERLVSLIALYSPNATVSANTTLALTAYYQWKNGQPINAGFDAADKKAEDLLLRGDTWSGIKTNSFYQNLMVEIDPSKLDPGVATMDMWMAIAFDYGSKVLDQGPKYKFAEGMINNIATSMGWKPHQVQAAIWTAMKSRYEPLRAAVKAKELKLGIGEMYEVKGKQRYRVKSDRSYDHFRLVHKMSMAPEVDMKAIEAAKYDFSNALSERTAQISWEAEPSNDVKDVSFIHKSDVATKFKYLEGIQGVLYDKSGNDIIAQMVGLSDIPHLFGYSAWQGAIGAGAQDFISVPLQGSGKNRGVKQDAAEVLNLYSAIRGLVLRQDAVVWHVPIYQEAKKRHNGFELRTARPVTEEEITLLYNELNKKFDTWELAPGYIENGMRVLNFTENIGNIEFQAGMDDIGASLPDSFGGGNLTSAGYRSDGDYIFNNWKEDKDGEGYTNRINSRRPDLQGRITDLRSNIEAFNEKFTKEYGPKFSKSDRAGSKGKSLNAIHWSNTKGLKELDPAYHGKGYKGAESQRKEEDPDHWVDRAYLGLKGYRKEAALGYEKYVATLDSDKIYDMVEDPDKLADKIQGVVDAVSGWAPNRLSVLEQLISQAGYDGYKARNVVAMFKPVPVVSAEESGIKFSKAPKDYAPKKTVTAYKLFRVKKAYPGKLFPLYINATTPFPMGEWELAEIGNNKKAGLALRPGLHAGDAPQATHIGTKAKKSDSKPSYRAPNTVWAEIEMADDVDWQKEADSRAGVVKSGPNKGKLNTKQAQITEQVPKDGFYRYRTNENMTGSWLIGGAMKIKRILTDAEVMAINKERGVKDLPRKEGETFDPTQWGFKAETKFSKGIPVGDGLTIQPGFLRKSGNTAHKITRGRKIVGHISGEVMNSTSKSSEIVQELGLDNGDFLDVWQTEMDKDIRGAGVYQKALRQAANEYPNGILIRKFQASSMLQKAAMKVEGAVNTKSFIHIPKESGPKTASKIKFSKSPDTKGFKTWSKGYDILEGPEIQNAVAGRGYVFQVEHGTTNDFNIFDPSVKGTVEGQFGRVNYFTSSFKDAEKNYAGEGADLTNRIERIEEDLWQAYEDGGIEEIQDEIDDLPGTYTDDNIARAIKLIAKKRLHGGNEHVKSLYVRADNPVYLNGDQKTYIENQDLEQFRENATAQVLEENEASEDQIEEFEDEIQDRMDELAADEEPAVYRALMEAVEQFEADIDVAQVYQELDIYDFEIEATDLEDRLRASESLMYAVNYDSASGELLQSHIIGQIFKNLGYDAIILMNADNRFSGMGLEIGTSHVHLFEDTPGKIKSRTENNGDYDESNPDIRFSKSPPFYSALEKGIEGIKQKTAPAAQWKGMLYRKDKQGNIIPKMPGVKAEELEWVGLDEWLTEQKGKVSKSSILDYMAANQTEINEVTKSGTDRGFSIEQTTTNIDEAQWRLLDPDGSEYSIFDTQEEAIEALNDANEAAVEYDPVVSDSNTKFEEYQIEGGKNYRELLLTMPVGQEPAPLQDKFPFKIQKMKDGKVDGIAYAATEAEAKTKADKIKADAYYDGAEIISTVAMQDAPTYKSGHWDVPNVLAHIRFNERKDVDGNNVLFLEEIQSDWHQDGRKRGYKNNAPIKIKHDGQRYYAIDPKTNEALKDSTTNTILRATTRERMEIRATNALNAGRMVPNAPFKKSWPLLAFKRMVRHAAENDFDSIAWTTGEQQAERYDLSKQISRIKYRQVGNKYEIKAEKGQESVLRKIASPSELEGIIGKEVTQRIVDGAGDVLDDGGIFTHKLEGLDLKVGGEGMSSFYDKILPAEVNKFFKKYGVKSGVMEVQTGDGAVGVHGITITPELKDVALKDGMPKFSKSPPVKSKEFKEWFGDSKMVDGKGNPLVVYHASDEDFTVFDSAKIGKNYTPHYGSGFYFGTEHRFASEFGRTVRQFYLSIQNPLTFSLSKVEEAKKQEMELSDFAKKEGYDGIYYKNGQVVAFYPNQIKETTNLKPTNDPDIRFSRTYTPGQQGYKTTGGFGERKKVTIKERFDEAKILAGTKLRQGMVDQFHSIREVLKDKEAWMMAHLTKSDTGALMTAINEGMPIMDPSGAIDIKEGSKSLKEILAPLGAELDDFLAWIAANRSEKLLGEDRENLFSADQTKAGKTLNQGTLSDGSSREALYDTVRADFEALGAAITDIAVKTGLVNEEEAQQWEEEGFYVPFYRMLEEQTNGRGPGNINGLTNQKAYKKLKGGRSQLDDLLTNTLLNWNHLISAGLRNQAGKKALETAETMGLASVVPKAIKSKDAIYVRDNGIEVWYELDKTPEGQLVLESITSLNYEGLNTPSMKGMRAFKRILTQGVTASPGFKIRNLIRDSLHAPAVATVSRNPLKNIAVGMRSAATMRRMEAGGGAFSQEGYIHGSDPDAVKSMVGIASDSILNTASKFTSLWRKYEGLGNTLENINRVASFQNDLAAGKSLLEANFNARDQLDFARSGSFTSVRVLAQTIPFLNARIQGLDKIARAFMDPTQRAQFIQVVGMYSVASVALALAMAGDDDYDEAPEWEKRTYHLFKAPGSEKMYRIPRPFEVGAIAYMAEQMTRQFTDENAKSKEMVSAIRNTLTDTFSMSLIPQAFKPILEVYANKDSFRDSPIESMSMERLSKKERAKPWTSNTAKGASAAMSEVLPEGVTLSPVQIEHLVGAYTGWAGSTILGATDFLVKKINGEVTPETKLSEYRWNPISSFARESEAKSSKYVERFYDNMSEINRMWADIQKYRETPRGKRITADQIAKLRYRKAYGKINKKLSEIRKQEERIYKDTTMSAEAKRSALVITRRRKNEFAKRATTMSKDVF